MVIHNLFFLVYLVWDNIDRLEETLTVLMELLSDSRYTDHTPQYTASSYQQRKQRTITQEVQPLAVSIPEDRVGPQPLKTAAIDCGGQEQISKRKDLLWLIARLVKGDNQWIPSWTGFNIKFHSHEPVMQGVVGYLPTINAPVPQLSTVN